MALPSIWSTSLIYRMWKKWRIITTGTGINLKTKRKRKRKNSLEGIVPEIS
jgi:hypothetical protein